jgi:branched-chain amino acid aminotransferase
VSGKKRLADLPENMIISERPVTMKEVKHASESGHIVELFGSGE